MQPFSGLFAVIINQFDLNPEEVDRIESFCRLRGYPVIAKIPHDPVVTKAMVRGLVVTELPETDFSLEIRRTWLRIEELARLGGDSPACDLFHGLWATGVCLSVFCVIFVRRKNEKHHCSCPINSPGRAGLASWDHFGHCDLYTIVEVTNGQVQNVRTLKNVPHQQGGCMAPVNHLAQNGVKVLIAGGMGMRPLMGFNQAGINVLYGGGVQTVGEAVDAFLKGTLQQFTMDFTCGGAGGGQPDRF